MSTLLAPEPPPTLHARQPRWKYLSDLLLQLGNVSPDRIRFDPIPGTATKDDAIGAKRSGTPCELVNGTLVEIAMSTRADYLGFYIAFLLQSFIDPNNNDFVITPRAQFEMADGNVREPDASFTRRERVPVSIPDSILPWCPDICVEVLSPSNTRSEMAIKRTDYFNSGCQIVWMIDPKTRTAEVYTAIDSFIALDESGVLDGGPLLPGFKIPLEILFAKLDQFGP